jgi:uncharacterized protein (TIGR03067 family)
MENTFSKLGWWILALILFPSPALAALDASYQELQGAWQVIELVDNGQTIAPEAIPGWLPSGGRLEIVDNAIVFTAHKDGNRHARVIALDATTYPKQLNIIDQNQISGHGIYRIDDGRLVVCLSPPAEVPRPTEFAARKDSRCVLLVLARSKVEPRVATTPATAASTTTTLTLPPPPAFPAALPASAQPITNADIGNLLPGNWKCNDAHGAFFLNLNKNGTFSTNRESVETSAYQKVFRKLPLSSGTWKLKNGQVMLTCTSSVYSDRVYKSFPFTIRSISPTQLEFVDFSGNVGKAVRTQP